MGLKYKINEQFFDTWSVEMAYVLGYIYADGNLQDIPAIRGKYMRIVSTDKDRIELLRTLLQSEHKIYFEVRPGNRKDRFELRVGSRKMYDALVRLGVTCRKSLTMELPPIPNDYLAAFSLGYFDGDGCAFLERNPKGNVRRLMAIYTSGSKNFLASLHTRLATVLGLKGRGLYSHGSSKGTFQLRYSTRDSLRLLSYLYGSKQLVAVAMERKYAIFSEYLELRGITGKNLPLVLMQKGPVAK